MELIDAIRQRHSVRSYENRPIEDEYKEKLAAYIEQCNCESGLHMQLVTNEATAFGGFMAHYGNFSGVQNYIALVGKDDKFLEEQCGYYGEKVVLYAQQLGLNTCWVAMTYNKKKADILIDKGEKLRLVISVGYGKTQGVPHKSKRKEDVYKVNGEIPMWFESGITAALLAPTAINQQKFMFSLDGNKVSAKAGTGILTKLDLGIVKYHFEIGAGKENFEWANTL